MAFELPALPYKKDALIPYLSEETLSYHHEKHHAGYVNNLNKLIVNTPYHQLDLVSIIRQSTGAIFNNAGQIWNHTFYWHCLKPQGGGKPHGELLSAIEQAFGSFEQFKEKFSQTAITTFGSGWGWLVKNKQGNLEIKSTSNAGTPLTEDCQPLLTCDVWEHAYYIDYRNARANYLEAFWALVNWDFVTDKMNAE